MRRKKLTFQLYALEENAWLLWYIPDDSLHILTSFNCWLLLGLDQGIGIQQLWDEFCEHYPDPPVQRGGFQQMVEQLQPLLTTPTEPQPYVEEYAGILTAAVEHWRRYSDSLYLHLNGLNIQVISSYKPLFSSLQYLCQTEVLKAHPDSVDCQFNIKTTSSETGIRYNLYCNNHRLNQALAAENLLPALIDHIQIMGYQNQDYLLAVHAAVVVKNEKALIFPGESGAGKSTLCVSLVKQGYACYSDELAILGEPKGLAKPLALPITIKQGSWPLLTPDWPELEKTTIWQRPDGRELKYLRLPKTAYPHQQPPITQQWVIFPKYDPACVRPICTRLSATELLTRLTAVGYQLKSGLNSEKIESLLNFIHQTPAYALSYSQLSDAHHHINALFFQECTPHAHE